MIRAHQIEHVSGRRGQGEGTSLPLARSICNLGLIPGELTGAVPPGTRFPIGDGLVCLTPDAPRSPDLERSYVTVRSALWSDTAEHRPQLIRSFRHPRDYFRAPGGRFRSTGRLRDARKTIAGEGAHAYPAHESTAQLSSASRL